MLLALIFCLYFHGLWTGFQLAARAWKFEKDKPIHITVTRRDFLDVAVMLGFVL
jgi:predicted Zn-dependent protease with MMP-like domain